MRFIAKTAKRYKARGFRLFISGSTFGVNRFANRERAIYHRFVGIETDTGKLIKSGGNHL